MCAFPLHNVLHTCRAEDGKLLENDGAMAAFDIVPTAAVRKPMFQETG
jgi:hypothetical protein